MTKKITKRIFVLLLAAMLVFPLASCDGEYSEANEPIPDTPAVSTPPETPVTVVPPAETPVVPEPVDNSYAEFDFLAGHIRNNDAEYYGNNIFAVFETEEAMVEYYSYLPQEQYDEYFNSYDAQFYQENQLVVIALQTHNEIEDLSNITSVRAVAEESGLVICVDILLDDGDGSHTIDWTLLKPIDKDIEIGNLKVKYKAHPSHSEWLAAAQGKN